MKIFILSLVLGLFSLETMALSCDITNYRDYIRSGKLTEKLIEETGVGCILTKVDLRGADLREAYLFRANLRGADLRRADLRGAILYQSKLQGADLRRADLRGANFRKSNTKGADFENAIYNDDTNFPLWDYLFKRKHNMIEMIEEK